LRASGDPGGMTAGRLVVMLRMIGRNAAVLDGGMQQWPGELMTGPGTAPAHLHFTPCESPIDRLADADQTAELARADDGLVLDARAFNRYTGEVTLIDPRPGHIPGAASAPWSAVIDTETNRFRPAAELRRHFNDLGASDAKSVIAYCGSGVSAC